MARGCDRIEHPTRDAALDAPKRLVYDTHVKGRDDLSAGLKVYASPNSDNLWHVGHSSQQKRVAFARCSDRANVKCRKASALRFSSRISERFPRQRLHPQ
jgi:hypothetical protein